MTKRRLVGLILLSLMMTGCISFDSKPDVDPEDTAMLLRICARRGATAIFEKNPDVGGYICPVICENILPGLQGECADIELKDHMLFVLGEAAKEWLPTWEEDIADIVAGLDILFDPEVDCTEEQMLYLRAFFTGIADACK